ncbi:hypothetical protein [Pseudoalteromonas virus vB_PspP-H6/1]|nr:hypothetical protein [Pseudoalteromonas virus vB_PspP-H6/1]
MNNLNSYYSKSISASVARSNPVHVHVKTLPTPTKSWEETEKRKLWCADCGLVVRNDSTFSEEEGHNRVFTWFASFEDYAAENAGGTSHALPRAKLAAEASL